MPAKIENDIEAANALVSLRSTCSDDEENKVRNKVDLSFNIHNSRAIIFIEKVRFLLPASLSFFFSNFL